MSNESNRDRKETGGGKITITFVILGEDVPVDVNPHQPLAAARNKALAESGNTGAPPDEWQVSRTDGSIISDVHRTIAQLGLSDGSRLRLSRERSGGG